MSRLRIVLVILAVILFLLFSTAASASLKINDIKLRSDGVDDEAKPGEILKIEFTVENTADEDIENVEAKIWFEKDGNKLKDDKGNRIKEEFDLGDIDEGDDERVNYDLLVPFDVDHGDVYDIFIKTTGEGADSSDDYSDEDSSESFKIRKKSHELLIYDTYFEPAVISCERNIILNLNVRNIGRNIEEDVNLSAVQGRMGMNISETFDLDDNYGDLDNIFSKAYSLKLNKLLNPGVYLVTIRAIFNDGKDGALKTINLTVNKCGTDTATGNTQTTGNDTTNRDAGTAETTSGNSAAGPATQPISSGTTRIISTPKTLSGSSGSKGFGMWILITILAEIAVIVIAVLIFLVLKKSR